MLKPDYIFECSWEICNKIGGIYTVLSTKAKSIKSGFDGKYILIGPDVWKETGENPDFLEDKSLLKCWKEKAENEGLKLRTGRWNIAGKPIVVLVDFTPYFSQKNQIFTLFWEKFKLDSITGQWDYIEPALFGYAAAKTIESFYNYFCSAKDKIIAHFHEWMTGTGVLYLELNVPQVGTAFTTHATVMGRSIAGNGLPLYKDMKKFDVGLLADRFGVKAKHSLEKLSADLSDSFTTVSSITAEECHYFLNKKPDIITPNGFEDSFVPNENDFENKRTIARKKLIQVSEALFNQKVSEDTLFVLNSGRYEFKNKGIDLYLNALGNLNSNKKPDRDIIAFICVPAGNFGPDNNLLERIKKIDYSNPVSNQYLTHRLIYAENDPVLEYIKKNNLNNSPEDNVKIIFVPAYLNGNDGVFNLEYYKLLIGFDISVFPSYYEPWGYTPLESIAFHIPTVTTTLAGFGKWVNEKFQQKYNGVEIINRSDDNDDFVVNNISERIWNFSNIKGKNIENAQNEAFDISRTALWENLINNYWNAYSIALLKVQERSELFKNKQLQYNLKIYKPSEQENPVWKKVLVKPNIPEKFSGLHKLSKNLWWSWNFEAIDLFKMIDPKLWEELDHNPISLLEELSAAKFDELNMNTVFLENYEKVLSDFNKYLSQKPKETETSIAYFSMEFGLHETLKIYSGGLGVLAGDYLKEASDSNKNITGIGLLYRYGYFSQKLRTDGDQIANYFPQKFTHIPIQAVRDNENNWIIIEVALPGRTVFAKVWKVEVGRVKLFLLDTDINDNSQSDRFITHQLYGGDNENRFKQELLLGVGGIRLLEKINLEPQLFHCNEGHAAFIGMERLRTFVQFKNLPFEQAIEIVRASTLYTTHTPVPAGHDIFSEDLLRTYIPHYADRLNLSWKEFMGLGRVNENDETENFSMSNLAAHLSQEINGVSRIHGDVSKELFKDHYKGYFPEETHIDYVTNGVHYPTWTAEDLQILYENEFGTDFLNDQSNPVHWEKIQNVADEKIYNIKRKLKNNLKEFLELKLLDDMTSRQEDPKTILNTISSLKTEALTIGFARRFATYKRAHLIFNNIERLKKIVNGNKPVRFIFAGKAHPKDIEGQNLIKYIIEISRLPEFIGKIIFLENYNMDIAKRLIQGVDIWLNTPTRPFEASGTSGEKAVMNGVVNLSVLDGWWAEGYRKNAGWAIKEERTYDDQKFQNELDSETIYNILENEIIPIYYKTNENNIPYEWISYIKNTISKVAPHFTMKRMLDDYYEKFYNKMSKRSLLLQANDFEIAGEIADWKKKIKNSWKNIKVVSLALPDSTIRPLVSGEIFKAEIILDLSDINAHDIGVEVLFGQKENDRVEKIMFSKELVLSESDENIGKYDCNFEILKPGVFDYVFRIFPKNKFLPHRQDFCLVKWA
ncbi:MAG: alpha-glucan family phosphorylase [Bacteroidales bacterium]|nr:alpha-glucan family phosphorylase [Bacteroidales bacterium]